MKKGTRVYVEKLCSCCGIAKDVNLFYKKSGAKNGLSSACKECESSRYKIRYQRDKEKILEHNKEYVKENYSSVKKYKQKWAKEKYKTSPQHRIRDKISSRINLALRGKNKSETTEDLIGCSITKLKHYLEGEFDSDMNWENYRHDGWHIDHIRPCASFNLELPEEQKKCFHYTNLQPLWWEQNLSKGAKCEARN